MSPPVRRLVHGLPRLEGDGREARQGLATADDFRFVRTFWEVDPRRIARSREETHEGDGGPHSLRAANTRPFWSDVHLLVDWERAASDSVNSRVPSVGNPQYYFRPGLT